MSTEISNLTPKARFLESGQNITKHRELVDSPEFQRAIDFALLHFSLGVVTNPVDDKQMSLGPAGLKLLGAQEFVSVLRNLSETPKAPANIITPANLNHRA